MRELKVQCDCGQKFKFDVEPVNNQMPFTVACPVCARDGTEKANLLLRAQAGAAPAPMPISPAVAAPSMAPQPALRVNPVAYAAPPPIAAASPPPIRASSPPPKASLKHDGWGQAESDFNKKGSYVVLVPAVLGGMVSAGYIPIEIPPLYIFIAIALGGLVGGYINILGRGPVWAGMIVGVVMGIGGYGALYWWMQNHNSVRKYEVSIAFVVGAAPGFGLQYLLQWLLKRRGSAES